MKNKSSPKIIKFEIFILHSNFNHAIMILSLSVVIANPSCLYKFVNQTINKKKFKS